MPNIRYRPLGQSVTLFTNFFLIIAALYHLKPASRSIFLTALGSDLLPYVWIATAVALGLIIPLYNQLVARHARLHIVLATCTLVIASLFAFYPTLQSGGFISAFGFYVFVDVMSVILVEQFWSLTNTVYSTDQGKRWYGLIATGGLLGGVAGGAFSGMLLKTTSLQTLDLLPVAACILVLLMLLNLVMGRLGLYVEQPGVTDATEVDQGHWRFIAGHRYLLLIAVILLLAQIVEPIIEYQFMKVIEATLTAREERTLFLAEFFSLMSAIAIGINLVLTPLIHRWLGAVGGLLMQPIAVIISSFYYMSHATLNSASALKIADRGLSYSINRASKELLYIPIDPVLIFKAKAWIDMFGYRLFKVVGSVLILLLTQWLPWRIDAQGLAWWVLLSCLIWLGVLAKLAVEYRVMAQRAASDAATARAT